MRTTVLAALAALAATALATPASAEPVTPYGPWTVSTAGAAGPFTVDATCVFGPMVVGEPPQLYATGVAVAPGAIGTTVRCHAGNVTAATTPGPVSVVTRRGLWDSPGPLCVSAEATFVTGTAVAPEVCV